MTLPRSRRPVAPLLVARSVYPKACRPAMLIVAAAGLLVGGAGPLVGAEPVALRVESFTVAPTSQPVAHVVVKNLRDVPYQGTVTLGVPDGWRITPAERDVALAPGQTDRVAFDIHGGVTLEANRYPVEVSATGAGARVSREQDVAATSAPYSKPTIDGDPADWDEAIPVTFTTGGKKTVVSTFWSSRRFSLLVAVEEDRLIGLSGDASAGPLDAVQLAISPKGSSTGTSPDDEAVRWEFLFVASDGGGKCFKLAEPGTPLAQTQKPRALGPLAYDDAKVAVRRQGKTTFYEMALPFRPMRNRIRPSEGREFCLSLVVHDPDGTGVRDWGRAAGLWPSERNRLAWGRWHGDDWGDNPPFDNKLPWGLCSSKY